MRKLGWGIVFFGLWVLLMDNIVMPLFVRRGEEFPLPDITALTEEEAQATVEELGLQFVVAGAEHSPARLEGTVLSQEPPAGTPVKRGRPVRVVVSKGSELVRLPYLMGVTVRQAALSLSDLGLVPGDVEWAFTDSLPADVVLATQPPAGSLVPKGSNVQLWVNQGGDRDTLAMPDLVGTQLADATTLLQDLGLELGVVIRQYITDLLPGTVLEQSEPPRARVRRGEVIDLVVAAPEGDA
jgi:serine/threonine-protein kinase